LSDFPIPRGRQTAQSHLNSGGVNRADIRSCTDYPPFMSSSELGAYLVSYARHFNLYPNIEFGKKVIHFGKSKGTSEWHLTFQDEPDAPKVFDKVVWATGGFLKPKSVAFGDQDQFAGRIIHSQEVRNLEDFKGQNVIVLGLGNTAGDIAINLTSHAQSVFLSHRRGTKILKMSGANGLPTDLMLTRTVAGVMGWVEAYFPWLFGKLLDSAAESNFKENWGENKAEWGFAPSPSIGEGFHTIMCNDDLIPLVKEGKIISTRGIKRIAGPKAVELEDGSVIDNIDAIIACIGYTSDLGMLSEAFTVVDAPGDAAPLPNLYMGIFPPDHSDSVAIMSNVHLNGPQMPGRELTAMAVAQIWVGNSSLPSRPAMDAWVRKHQAWLWKRIERAPGLHRGDVLAIEWMKFVHDAAGTAIYEYIGWSWKAWKLWWTDSELYKALAHGPATPHANRLFETGKRPAWEGARQAVLDVNDEAKELRNATKTKK
jgi:dimethylaniline monooxygenase (N-oxide forming)